MVITDSGGIQEEACYFKRPTLVCRAFTERMNRYSILVRTSDKLYENFTRNINARWWQEFSDRCEFGDGKAAERIVDILKNEESIW